MKKFATLLILVFGLFACSESVIETSTEIFEHDENFVTKEEAEIIAGNIVFPVKKRMPGKNLKDTYEITGSQSKNISKVSSAPGFDNKTVFYIINYLEGGFVIIAGDKRSIPILAYSDSDNFPVDENETYPGGLVEWLSFQKESVENLRINGDEINPKDTQMDWNPCPIQKTITPNLSMQNDCDPCEDQSALLGPLLTTTWDQVCGYNQLMPVLTGCNNVPCGRAFAGCVPVAMAQIMRFHQHPNNYNFANMPNGVGTIEVATLINDIFNSFPTHQVSLECGLTGVNSTHNFASTFTTDFNYSSTLRANYNHHTVKSELDNNRPVILSGGDKVGWWIFTKMVGGHMWVADGYITTFSCSTGSNTLSFHMNWGWNGQGNGFFAFNNFNPTVHGQNWTFNYDREMIYNINP